MAGLFVYEFALVYRFKMVAKVMLANWKCKSIFKYFFNMIITVIMPVVKNKILSNKVIKN